MKKFSAKFLLILNLSLIALQWQCAGKRQTNQDETQKSPDFIPSDWDGSYDRNDSELKTSEL